MRACRHMADGRRDDARPGAICRRYVKGICRQALATVTAATARRQYADVSFIYHDALESYGHARCGRVADLLLRSRLR